MLEKTFEKKSALISIVVTIGPLIVWPKIVIVAAVACKHIDSVCVCVCACVRASVCVCACVRASVCVCARARARARAYVRVRASVCVCARESVCFV